MISGDSEVVEFFRGFFRGVLVSSLGESAAEALLSILRRGLGREPSELFWEDPKAFYSGLERVLGMGAKVLIDLFVSAINHEGNLNIKSENFLKLIRNGSPKSIEEIRLIIRGLAEGKKGEG